jgi:hypothetical protein
MLRAAVPIEVRRDDTLDHAAPCSLVTAPGLELLVVIVGLFLALQPNAWWQDRADRQMEQRRNGVFVAASSRFVVRHEP